jgi:hypothetical protein
VAVPSLRAKARHSRNRVEGRSWYATRHRRTGQEGNAAAREWRSASGSLAGRQRSSCQIWRQTRCGLKEGIVSVPRDVVEWSRRTEVRMHR